MKINICIVNIMIFMLSFADICTGAQSYRREYDDYQPGMFNYYIGFEGVYNVIDYKLKNLESKFSNNFAAENFLIGVDVDNIFKLEVFYQYAPSFKGKMITSPTFGHIMNSFYSFGFGIAPYLKLHKYCDGIFSAGFLRQTAKAYSFNNTIRTTGNGFKIGFGVGLHLNSNLDLKIMYNQIVFTGYSDMKSSFSPTVGLVIKF